MSTKDEKEWLKAILEGKIKPGDSEWGRIWREKDFSGVREVLRGIGIREPDECVVDRAKMWQVIAAYRGQGKSRKSIFGWRWVAAVVLPLMLGGVLWLVSRERPETILADHVSVIDPGGPCAVLIMERGEKIDLSSLAGDTTLNQGNVLIRLDSSKSVKYERVEMKPTKVEYNTIVVPRKGEYQLILADGSKVYLNSESRLRFPICFMGKERRVYLEGEGYFEVVKDTTKPFVVEAGELDVQVLGTSFNVNAYASEKTIRTTLASGKVQVNDRLSGRGEIMKSGQQVEWKNGCFSAKEVDVSIYTSWIHGKFNFEEGATLEEIAAQLQRWYDVDFFFVAEKLKYYTFAGVINKEYTVNKIFSIIEKTTRVKFELKGRVVIVGE